MPPESLDLCTIFKSIVLVAFPAFTKCEHQTAAAAQSGADWGGGVGGLLVQLLVGENRNAGW